MTEENNLDPEGAIVERILGDADAEAARLIANAGRAAEAEGLKTQREIEKIEADIRTGWDAKVEKIRMREVSTARIESRRILLNAREEAVSRMFGEIEEGLGHLRENPGRYRESLCRLAAEAAAAIGGEEVVLRFGERDGGLVDDAFVDEVKARLEGAAAGPRFRVEFESGDNGGGCVATSPDGRIVFDNTYGRRLERLRPELRATIVSELEKSNE